MKCPIRAITVRSLLPSRLNTKGRPACQVAPLPDISNGLTTEMKVRTLAIASCVTLATASSSAIAHQKTSSLSQSEKLQAIVTRSSQQQIALWLSETDLWIANYRQAEALLGRELLRGGDENSFLRHRAEIVRLTCSAEQAGTSFLERVERLRTAHERLRQSHRNFMATMKTMAARSGSSRKPETAIDQPY